MRKPIHSDEEIREIGLRLKEEKGSVTVEELTAAVRGANKRIRRIVQEITVTSLRRVASRTRRR